MESRVRSVGGVEDESVSGDVGGLSLGGRLLGVGEGGGWDFGGVGGGVGVLESVGLGGSSQYRPWEGSEVLLRGGYYGRSVDERLPSFESQFQEVPPLGPYPGEGGYGGGYAVSGLECSLMGKRSSGRVSASSVSASSASASSSSLDTHPTLVSQLRKKIRTGSLEESGSENSSLQDTPGQVAAISSTDPSPDSLSTLPDSLKPPGTNPNPQHRLQSQPSLRQTLQPRQSKQRKQVPAPSVDGDKPTKKKRKRCGECSGCQKKDNCGDCAPCRNEKSHQICKIRRCERLIEKKPKKVSNSGDPAKLSTTQRSLNNRQIDMHTQQTNQHSHFGFPQSSSISAVTGDNSLWCQQTSLSQQHQSGSSNTTCSESWSSHYHLTQPTNSMPPPCVPSAQNSASIFDHHFDSFIRRPQTGGTPIILSSINSGCSRSSTHNYHEVPSPNPSASGFIPVNGNSSSLGYNLAVNSETKPYIGRNGLISPRNVSVQGNSQPGCPPRPAEGLIEILPNCNKSSLTLFEGSPGHIKRTGVSPDSTTNYTKSFLAFRAENTSSYGVFSAPSTGNPCYDAITLMSIPKHEVQKRRTTANTTSMSTSSVISSSNDTEVPIPALAVFHRQ